MAGCESFQTAIDYIRLNTYRISEVLKHLPQNAENSQKISILDSLKEQFARLERKLLSHTNQNWDEISDFSFLEHADNILFLISGRDIKPREQFKNVEALKEAKYASLPSMIVYQLDNGLIRRFTNHNFLDKIINNNFPIIALGKRIIDEDRRISLLKELNEQNLESKISKAQSLSLKKRAVSTQLFEYFKRTTGEEHPVKSELIQQSLSIAKSNSEKTKPINGETDFIFINADKLKIPRLNIYPSDVINMASVITARFPFPVTLLELGTLAGYSAINILRCLPKGSKIISCEINPLHYAISLRNVMEAEEQRIIERDSIDIHFGDALECINKLQSIGRRIDIAFLDADKQAKRYIPGIIKLGASLFISDNATRHGMVISPQIHDDLAISEANNFMFSTENNFGFFAEKEDGDHQAFVFLMNEKEKTKMTEFKKEYLENWKKKYAQLGTCPLRLHNALERFVVLSLGIESTDSTHIIKFMPILSTAKCNSFVQKIFARELVSLFPKNNISLLDMFLDEELPISLSKEEKNNIKSCAISSYETIERTGSVFVSRL